MPYPRKDASQDGQAGILQHPLLEIAKREPWLVKLVLANVSISHCQMLQPAQRTLSAGAMAPEKSSSKQTACTRKRDMALRTPAQTEI